MRRSVPILLVLAFLVTVSGSILAGEPITIGETIKIPSKILGEERAIVVSTPQGYERGQGKYPVLYMTDGGGHLTHTRGTVDFLVNNGLMPDVIIVGINNTDRTRDLTPTKASMTGPDGTDREFPTSGGANTFLDFFEKELFPYIDSHYRTTPLRAFTGHSFGGLFALNAFFTRPTVFGVVLACSPTLRWDDALPLRQAESFLENRAALPATLFVTMANELEGEPNPNLLDRLEQTLRSKRLDGFEWQVMRMPEETHGSVVLRSHYWGLRKAFEGWRLPLDPETGLVTGGLAGIRGHYAKLSKRYSFEVVPPEGTVNLAGYQFLGRDDAAGAIEIFEYNTKLYPGSANVYDSLGEALEKAGRLEEAAKSYNKAVENGKVLAAPFLNIYTTNRDRVLEALKKAPAK